MPVPGDSDISKFQTGPLCLPGDTARFPEPRWSALPKVSPILAQHLLLLGSLAWWGRAATARHHLFCCLFPGCWPVNTAGPAELPGHCGGPLSTVTWFSGARPRLGLLCEACCHLSQEDHNQRLLSPGGGALVMLIHSENLWLAFFQVLSTIRSFNPLRSPAR